MSPKVLNDFQRLRSRLRGIALKMGCPVTDDPFLGKWLLKLYDEVPIETEAFCQMRAELEVEADSDGAVQRSPW